MGFKRKNAGDSEPANEVQQQNIDGSDRSLMATLREPYAIGYWQANPTRYGENECETRNNCSRAGWGYALR